MTAPVDNPVRSVDRTAIVVLIVVVLCGLALRVWNVNFDRGIGSHPDERSTACFYATSLRLPNSLEEFRDPRQSPLNPLWDVEQQTRRGFTYGHFPLYLGASVGEGMHRLSPLAERAGLPHSVVNIMARADQECGAIAVAGRLTIALLDTLTIVILFFLGRLIFGSIVGLLAASFYAFSAQAVQLSHFFAMDPASTTFIVLAVYGGVKMWRTVSLGSAILTGVAAGFAIASKFSSLPVLAAPVTAGILAIVYEGQRASRDGVEPDGRIQFRALLGLIIAMVVAVVAFTVTSPYAVLDWRNFLQATLVEQGRMVRGIADMPFTRQYRNTIPYVYFIQQQVAWGLWWPLGLVALAGTVTMLVELVLTLLRLAKNWVLSAQGKAHLIRLPELYQADLLISWAWVAPYFVITGAFLAKFNRYMSPLLPFAALFAAGLIWLLWRKPQTTQPDDDESLAGDSTPKTLPGGGRFTSLRIRRGLAVALASVGIVGGLFWSVAYVNGVYRGEHTWIEASRWIYENAPEGSVILWELWDDPLPKTILGEPGMDMGTHGLRNIDWSPYEEDTAAKYEVLKAKLREADLVAYSSKRIYDSVDELPERYPLTTRYYDAMWDGSLGYELAFEATSPPKLLGLEFDDRNADESWSLYDHPQVTIFRKVRDLSDAEFDAVLGGTWEDAVPYFTGELSVFERPLVWIGLRGGPGAEYEGALGSIVKLLAGDDAPRAETVKEAAQLLPVPLAELPIVDDYRWNDWASERPIAAAVIWWLVLTLLGLAIWPICFRLFGSFRDRGYFLSRTAGWLMAGWLLWYAASVGGLYNTVRNAWISAAVAAVAGAVVAYRTRHEMAQFLRDRWQLLLAGEALVGGAYLVFILIRMANPDLWQPWFGGEKFMEFAFLNGILRSAVFPPVDPHFAGGFINYYYFGIYLSTYLIKLTGIYAEVAFNLTIAMLFALTVSNAFSIAYTAYGYLAGAGQNLTLPWFRGLAAALLAPFFIAVIGNLDGFAQIVRRLSEQGQLRASSSSTALAVLPDAVIGLGSTLTGQSPMPAYDFWGPSRVIPNTINEFPYWSFLFADLHPHVIGIPLALLFCALLLALLSTQKVGWRQLFPVLVAMGFLLGALSSVNLWELPTYFGLGILGLAVLQFRSRMRVSLLATVGGALVFLGVAVFTFLPFFRNYANVGASGIGFVREPDAVGTWLLIWGLLIFVIASWIVFAAIRRPNVYRSGTRTTVPTGEERAISLAARKYDRLPRLVYLHRMLVRTPTFGYLFGVSLIPFSLVAAVVLFAVGYAVLGICVALLGTSWLLLWKRGTDSDPAALLVAVLAFAGIAILAGTQVIFLRDFLQGGDWYRMNTLFKFFIQVWVLLGLASGIALPRLWRGIVSPSRSGSHQRTKLVRAFAVGWACMLSVLILTSLSFTAFGTPARLSQRLNGWRPAFGTLNGLDYMREGVYSWPDDSSTIELEYDWEAIQWLLDNVRGNPIILESSEIDYYRAGSSRVASLTGISGLRGMHTSEQRSGPLLAQREALHREFWDTPDIARTMDILETLGVSLVYVGQLERQLHPDGVAKLESMEQESLLLPLFRNAGVTIYGVPGALTERADGTYVPAPRSGASRG